MRLINSDIIMNKGISSDAIKKILKTYKIQDVDINLELLCKQDVSDYYIDDVTLYDDLLNSNDPRNKKTNMLILKDSKRKDHKSELICFKPHQDRIQVRTLKQKLGDISTSYVIEQFTDNTYTEFFRHFYVPMNAFITAYAKMQGLRVPEDICIFYKGGNLFRILLNDITKLMDSRKQYQDLLKRSDADFQIFINPTIPNYSRVFQDVSNLVLYNLSIFRKCIHQKDLFKFLKIDEIVLCNLFKKEFENSGIHDIASISLLNKNSKRDFSINNVDYGGDDVILYKEHASILANIPKVKVSKEFFISRNTTLNFTRKDDLIANFDLTRMKRNIRIKVIKKDNTVQILNVPCEVIDVSIPKGKDHALHSMQNNINHYIKKFEFVSSSSNSNSNSNSGSNRFTFWSPNINYMVKDLDDVLFKQNDYPWSDIKINKRMMRYFISLMFHYIMMGILEKKSIVERLKSFNEELESMIVLNECYIYKKDCDATSVSRILEVKFKKLSLRINKIKNLEEKKEQLKLFVEFNEKIRIILKALIKDVKSIIENYSSISEKKLNNIFNKLIVHQSTFILGGRRHQ